MSAAILAPLQVALADEPPSPHSFTANVGLFSEYVFRGLTQTNGDPAIQGGFDYAYNFGPASFYVGTWGSNISWLVDNKSYTSSSLENDWYGGFRGNFGQTDFTWDAGFLYYWYPGDVATGFVKADTQELYGALGWKWLSVKYSYSIGNKTFGVRDSSGTWYLDFSASYPVAETGLTLLAHYGIQKYSGTDPALAGISNNDNIFSYDDWKLGATYDLGKLTKTLSSTTLGAFYADTSGANNCGYGTASESCSSPGLVGPYPNNIAKGKFVVYLQRTF